MSYVALCLNVFSKALQNILKTESNKNIAMNMKISRLEQIRKYKKFTRILKLQLKLLKS